MDLKLWEKQLLQMNDICDGDAVCDVDLNERISKLNKNQCRIFDNLSNHFQYQQRHENGECDCKHFKPVHMFISGVGGTGKSFLIETIRAKVAEIWKGSGIDGEIMCVVAAPTNLATYIINGVTVHRLFQLPMSMKVKLLVIGHCPKHHRR